MITPLRVTNRVTNGGIWRVSEGIFRGHGKNRCFFYLFKSTPYNVSMAEREGFEPSTFGSIPTFPQGVDHALTNSRYLEGTLGYMTVKHNE